MVKRNDQRQDLAPVISDLVHLPEGAIDGIARRIIASD
jgi:hypothetical protein